MGEDHGRGPPLTREPHAEWYHGSPLRLDRVKAGSTVTPVIALARAFAHKPGFVSIDVRERDGERTVTLEHDGRRDGYLYRVLVADPASDLEQHPGSKLALGEEMLATRDLPVEFIEELPVTWSTGTRKVTYAS